MKQYKTIHTFAGMEIIPGVLALSGGLLKMTTDIREVSYGSAHGLSERSSYFSHDDIEKMKSRLPGGWRLPTAKEWRLILTKNRDVRPGSNVNGKPFCHYAFIGARICGKNHNALLIFPDGAVMHGRYINKPDENHQNPGFSEEDVKNYLAQGAAVIFALGHYDALNGIWSEYGISGFCWAADRLDEDDARGVYFDENYLFDDDSSDAAKSFHAVKLIK